MGTENRPNSANELEDELAERRYTERRARRRFRFLDKRTGFDRRSLADSGTAEGPVGRLLLLLRRNRTAFAILLFALNLLNVTDYACTLIALRSGIPEGNPFMAELFAQGNVSAGRAKIALVLLVSMLLWRFRTFRKALLTAVAMLAGFLAIFVYHAVGLAMVLGRT